MVQVDLYYNGNKRTFYFFNLLDGLLWLENKLFDYIIIENEERVECDDISMYIDRLNAYSKEVYGSYYPR